MQIVYPLFQGEYASRLYPWFFRNIRYKSGEYQRAASGTVRVAFTVDKKGKLRDIEILRAHNDVCREKTIETLKKSPRWTPGTANGVPSTYVTKPPSNSSTAKWPPAEPHSSSRHLRC